MIFVIAFIHLTWCWQYPSYDSKNIQHSFLLLLNSISLHGYTLLLLFTRQFVDTWVVSLNAAVNDHVQVLVWTWLSPTIILYLTF